MKNRDCVVYNLPVTRRRNIYNTFLQDPQLNNALNFILQADSLHSNDNADKSDVIKSLKDAVLTINDFITKIAG